MEFLNKHGWLFLLTAMIGDIVVSLILSFFYKGYSNIKMSISALGNPNSPVRLPFNIWMVLEGILFLAAIPAIYTFYNPVLGGITKAMVAFVAIFAVGACIFTGFFSVNESKDVVTTASKIHGAGSVIGFMLFLFVPLLVGILSFKNGESGMGIISIVCFAISMVFFVLFVMSDKQEFKYTVIQNEGLWQRLNLAFMYLPLIVVSIKKLTEK
ncbi:MAG: DUF998 domain-containing protein [Lachnospiraceae bacterium]|nr:DUF998 domain-containing protein [Lachnospiraceae bacterium]